jgi:cysteinyl-tRNA synthetase, unknown class
MNKKIRTLLNIGLACLLTFACSDGDGNSSIPALDFRLEMRNFVQQISLYAKSTDPDFLIIPQNGQELLTSTGDAKGSVMSSYINAIDAVGREDLFYGYEADDKATPEEDNTFLISLCEVARAHGKVVLTTDYCFTHSKMDDSFVRNQSKGYISFAADHRELDNIPDYPATIRNEHAFDVEQISQAQNFLYLINPSAFAVKQDFIDALRATNYDVLLIDLFYNDDALSALDIESLKTKANGGSRLVLAYMSIGEAEDYRYYWSTLDKALIYQANPDWPGNYAVKYWNPGWKDVIFGNEDSYINKIIEAGFDGCYLDIIEAYEYFE